MLVAPQGQGTLAEQVAQRNPPVVRLEAPGLLPFVAGIPLKGPRWFKAPSRPPAPPPSLPAWQLFLLSQNSEMWPHGHGIISEKDPETVKGSRLPIQVLGRVWVSSPASASTCNRRGLLSQAGPVAWSLGGILLLLVCHPTITISCVGLRWALFPGQGLGAP